MSSERFRFALQGSENEINASSLHYTSTSQQVGHELSHISFNHIAEECHAGHCV
jgi:hypothetical protein